MRFGTWNVSTLYGAGSLMTVAKELSKYKIDLVGVQEVRWDRGNTETEEECRVFYGKGNENREFST
jgi:exonuclease III